MKDNEVDGLRKVFKKMRYVLAALATGTMLWCGAPGAQAMDEIMPLAEVAPGMTGELYTVVDSSGDIRSFDVTILGVMRNGKSMPYIIARSEGAFADTDGGLMQGMSGSPVYVDGRLIGAGSATVKEMDPHTFLITPIEEMLPLWDMPDTKNQSRPKVVDLRKAAEEKAAKDAKEAKEAKEAAKDDGTAPKDGADAKPEGNPKDATALKDGAAPKDESGKETALDPSVGSKDNPQEEALGAEKETVVKEEPSGAEKEAAVKGETSDAAPESARQAAAEEKKGSDAVPAGEKQEKSLVYASGFGDMGMRFLQRKLEPMGYKALPFGGISSESYETDYDAVLYPGSAIGAALAYGDFAFAATGTVTAVEDDGRVLAFGHPFLHRGNVNYFMTSASVFAMVNGMTDGMKLANNGSIIGRINQDRSTGIAGILGTFPSVVPIRLTVDDKTLDRSVSYAATMAYDEAFIPVLTQAIAYAALGRTVDTMNESTVKVDFSIRTDAVENGLFERSNLFYAPADTGQIAFGELAQAMTLIANDKQAEADIYDVKVNVSSEAIRRTASLVTAVPEKPTAKPGETVNFKVTLRPYRAETITVKVPFTVPKTRHDGTMHLDVHGGGLVSLEKLLQAAQAESGILMPENPEEVKTVKDYLKEMKQTDANNEIVIEPGPGPVLSEKEQKKEIEEAIRRQQELQETGGKAENTPPKAKLATEYVIDNVIHTAIEVSGKDA